MAIRVLPIHWLGAIQVSNQGFTLYAVKKKKEKEKEKKHTGKRNFGAF